MAPLFLQVIVSLLIFDKTLDKIISILSFALAFLATQDCQVLLDSIGLNFVGIFFHILSRGYCPIAQAMMNMCLLLFKTASLGALDPPFITFCATTGEFLYTEYTGFVLYLTFFAGFQCWLYFFGQLFQHWCGQKKNPLVKNAGHCTAGKNCVHYKTLQSMNKHLNDKLNLENK